MSRAAGRYLIVFVVCALLVWMIAAATVVFLTADTTPEDYEEASDEITSNHPQHQQPVSEMIVIVLFVYVLVSTFRSIQKRVGGRSDGE